MLDFLALNNILHIENLTSNSNNLDIKLLMNIMHISLMLHAYLKYKIKY